jgi:hypothetical protein
MFRVTLSMAGNVVKKYPFQDKASVTVGRDADCDIPIDNVAVSRRHCTLAEVDGSWILEDLQSGNGTFYNGQKIHTQAIGSGDSFVIGKYSLLFEVLDDAQEVVKESLKKAGGEDVTFRLDRKELDKLIGKAARGGEHKGALVPEGGGAPIPLTRPYLFAGSTSDCAIPAAGPFVAPRLVLLVREEGGIRAVRIGGKFGKVTVNNQDLDNRVLREGDVLSICSKRFQYTEQA